MIALVLSVVLTGCKPNDSTSSDTDDVAPGVAPTPAAAASAEPSPAPSQAKALLQELRAISPPLNDPVTIPRAQHICSELRLGVVQDQVLVDVQTQLGLTHDALDPDQARRALAVLRSQPWCTG